MKPLLFIWTVVFCQSISAAEGAPKLLLAKTWNESIDPTGWWISEKYDGMRGFWDGKALWTRGGKAIAAPAAAVAALRKLRRVESDSVFIIGNGA